VRSSAPVEPLAHDAIHDQARPDAVLAGIARALRPDGVFLMVDIRAESAVGDNLDHPLDTFIEEDFVNDCDVARLA
jgi:hypothetical protein